ncbi:MAG: N-formylglutamate amidohydrolase [Patescibacteria group bacterium]
MFFETGIGYRVFSENQVLIFEPMGDANVIITISHDGLSPGDFFGFWPERKTVEFGSDKYVWRIAKDVLAEAGVYAIRGLFPRFLVDYNRLPEVDNKLVSSHHSYHEAIFSFIRMIRESDASPLLLDLHGFSRQPFAEEFDIILGTKNRATVKTDIDFKLAVFLRERGYRVFLPEEDTPDKNCSHYNGGFTVCRYSEEFGIDAIQIEIARHFRTKGGEEEGKKLSCDLAEFIKNNFPPVI